jgi:hypothetical protein
MSFTSNSNNFIRNKQITKYIYRKIPKQTTMKITPEKLKQTLMIIF